MYLEVGALQTGTLEMKEKVRTQGVIYLEGIANIAIAAEDRAIKTRTVETSGTEPLALEAADMKARAITLIVSPFCLSEGRQLGEVENLAVTDR
jgi:hypothetical protein